MKNYIGTKIVSAEPQDKDYGPPETQGQPGYKVVYPDGYTSWSPAAAFEEAYRETTGMPFGLAVEALKKGHKVARAGWNGKGMWVAYTPGTEFPPEVAKPGRATQLRVAESPTEKVRLLPRIDMRTADGSMLIGWTPNGIDVLADDWQVVG